MSLNPHGVGYELLPKARKGTCLSLEQVQERHHIDGSQDRLALYLSMDHDVAEDANAAYGSSEYKVCERRSCRCKSNNNKHVSAVPLSWVIRWKVRRSSKSSGGRGPMSSQALRSGCRAHCPVSLSPSSKLWPPTRHKEPAC
jgi:hypothetical protein